MGFQRLAADLDGAQGMLSRLPTPFDLLADLVGDLDQFSEDDRAAALGAILETYGPTWVKNVRQGREPGMGPPLRSPVAMMRTFAPKLGQRAAYRFLDRAGGNWRRAVVLALEAQRRRAAIGDLVSRGYSPVAARARRRRHPEEDPATAPPPRPPRRIGG